MFDFIADKLNEYKNKYSENKKISTSVISNKLLFNTKNTKKTNYQTCTLGKFFLKKHF